MTNEEKKNKIAQLEKRRNELYDELDKIRNEIHDTNLDGSNYVGKFIYIEHYGYMYVTRQNIDNQMYSDERMWFRGFYFNGSISSYSDDFYFESDASKDWYIPINIFEQNHIYGLIEEMTMTEFLQKYNELSTKHNQNVESMIAKMKDYGI